MDIADFVIGLVSGLIGFGISYATFSRNKTKDDKSDGKQDGIMLTEIGYIKANTDEIKNEQKEQRKVNADHTERLAKVEASAKQAHLRIDRMEGREYPTAHYGHEE